MLRAIVSTALVVSMLAGCKTYDSEGKLAYSAGVRGFEKPQMYHSLLPEGTAHLTPTYAVSYADLILVSGLVVLVYYVVDPFAPDWDILEKRFPDGRVQYSLRMKNVHVGGEGEARQVLVRRAAELAREQGKTGYEIRSYSESIDSRIFFPRRTAEAEVYLLAPPEPPKLTALDARPPLAGEPARFILKPPFQ
jgi:hypothetical protein